MQFCKYKTFFVLAMFASLTGRAQEVLLKVEAVDLALANNYDIQIANNDVLAAENNASIYNTGFLPTLSGNTGANYSNTNTNVKYQDDSENQTRGATTYSFNASLGLNYTLFDGLGRNYNHKRLKENYNLTELQARQVIESTILSIFSVYYEVARLTQNEINQRETISISKRRLLRARYGYEYGQNTQLDVLNAEVDYNNDSISYLNIRQELENVKRDLNVLLGRDVNIAFTVDTTITYQQGLTKELLLDEAMKQNVRIMQNEGLLRNSEFDIAINQAGYMPRVNLNANYQWNDRSYDPTSFFQHQTIYGPTAGMSLTWNIFDGGTTKTRVQNAKIALENQRVSLEQSQQFVERDVNNAWGFYTNALFVLEAEGKNLETNQRNFDRTLEQYNFGQITSIEFRQAQFNLLRAQLNFNQAKYEAKTAELALLKLAGSLLSAQF